MGANSNGQALEKFVEARLIEQGYKPIEDGAWLLEHCRKKDLPQGNYYAKEVVVGESAIKGKKRRVELFLAGTAFPNGLIIECKWQEVPGSAEDKLFRLPQDIQKTPITTVVVLDGSGFSEGIKDYLRSQVDRRLFYAMHSMKEFYEAVNRGFLKSGVIIPMISPKRKEPPPLLPHFRPLMLPWEEVMS